MPRTTTYEKRLDHIAFSLALKGCTNEEIANAFEINRRTLTRWCNEFPTLRDAIEEGKVVADSEVEYSLYKKAIGHTVTTTETSYETDTSGQPKNIKKKTIEKEVPPDTMAIMYWLNNRKRGVWSQKQEIDIKASNDSESDIVIVLPSNNRQASIEGTVELKEPEE